MKKLQNGEIDLMSSLSYTDERAKTMLFSDLPMGEEKYYLYADLANSDISASDISSLNGQLPCVLWKMITPFIPMIFINSILQPSLLRPFSVMSRSG